MPLSPGADGVHRAIAGNEAGDQHHQVADCLQAADLSDVISHRHDTLFPGTVSAAVESALRLDPVAYDLALAVLADRSEPVNSALEAVERMRFPCGDHLK